MTQQKSSSLGGIVIQTVVSQDDLATLEAVDMLTKQGFIMMSCAYCPLDPTIKVLVFCGRKIKSTN